MSAPEIGADLTAYWPSEPPTSGRVRLRAFEDRDVPMVRDLATDPHVPLIGTLPAGADEEQAAAYVARQRARTPDGIGFSFCVADAGTDEALGQIGLWPRAQGRASIGYCVAPRARGRHVATDGLHALTAFAWTLPEPVRLHRLEAYVEPWNTASLGTAEAAGYVREGLLRSHQEIGGERRDMVLLAAVRP